MRPLTVGMLRLMIQDIDANALVVMPAADHEYRRVHCAAIGTAILMDRVLSEDHDSDLEDGETRVNVCVIE